MLKNITLDIGLAVSAMVVSECAASRAVDVADTCFEIVASQGVLAEVVGLHMRETVCYAAREERNPLAMDRADTNLN